jgi:hypothetical protein
MSSFSTTLSVGGASSGSSNPALGNSLRSSNFKYEHLNLNIDEHGFPIKGVKQLTRQRRDVSLVFIEKFSMVLHFFQVHGLLWLMGSQWPWPQM